MHRICILRVAVRNGFVKLLLYLLFKPPLQDRENGSVELDEANSVGYVLVDCLTVFDARAIGSFRTDAAEHLIVGVGLRLDNPPSAQQFQLGDKSGVFLGCECQFETTAAGEHLKGIVVGHKKCS